MGEGEVGRGGLRGERRQSGWEREERAELGKRGREGGKREGKTWFRATLLSFPFWACRWACGRLSGLRCLPPLPLEDAGWGRRRCRTGGNQAGLIDSNVIFLFFLLPFFAPLLWLMRVPAIGYRCRGDRPDWACRPLRQIDTCSWFGAGLVTCVSGRMGGAGIEA